MDLSRAFLAPIATGADTICVNLRASAVRLFCVYNESPLRGSGNLAVDGPHSTDHPAQAAFIVASPTHISDDVERD